jgi:hypothetical protein
MRHFIASYTLHIFFGCAIIVIAEARKGMEIIFAKCFIHGEPYLPSKMNPVFAIMLLAINIHIY